jgi:1-deoxy-D-xylulose-5-phosphate synthase
MSLLHGLRGPEDLRPLDEEQLSTLAAEIRSFLVEKVSRTGGHIGPNLGIVELTLAIHRVFDSPRDRILFDTGHQAYVHKIITGRRDDFDTLRTEGGMSGYPSRAESEHDLVENSHASTALSYADGLAKAHRLRNENRHVVAVVGDGALTGGMAWEALNNIAAEPDSRIVIVVNDNGRSYTPTVGGFARHLASFRTDPRYEKALASVKSGLGRTPIVGPATYDMLHAVKRGIKDALAPQGIFEDLGLKYVGPIDGHDIDQLEQALHQAKQFSGPVIVHAITHKGLGYQPALDNLEDNLHSPGGAFDPGTGRQLDAGAETFKDVIREELVRIGEKRADVVAITAAMLYPTGLDGFAAAFPERVFDVGIAEQHAVTSAAGMAMAGLHPVVAIYATFLNRAFDQVLMDAALHRCGITFLLDRAGVTGEDGGSHNGMWDMSILQVVPGLRLAAPRDGIRLRELLGEALLVDDAPTVLRVPKGPIPPDRQAVERVGDIDVMSRTGDERVLIVAFGPMVGVAVDAAERLLAQGIGVVVVDPRWAKPLDPVLAELARSSSVVVSIEDNVRTAGCGTAVAQLLRDHDVDTKVEVLGIPERFLQHAKRTAILQQIGLDAQSVTRRIIDLMAPAEPVRPRASRANESGVIRAVR